MCNLLFWIAAQLLLLWILTRLAQSYRYRKIFKIAFLPSLVLEGVVRTFACCLSAKPVDRIGFFENGKPFLKDGKSRIPLFGPAIFLTLWLGLLFCVFHFWATRVEGLNAYAMALPYADPPAISAGVLKIDARAYIYELKIFAATVNWESFGVWLFLYVFVGIFPFLTVHSKELGIGAVIICLLALLTYFFNYFGIRPGFLSRGWYVRSWMLPDFYRVYSLFVTILGATFVPHAVAVAAWSGIQWKFQGHTKPEQAQKQKQKKKSRGRKVPQPAR